MSTQRQTVTARVIQNLAARNQVAYQVTATDRLAGRRLVAAKLLTSRLGLEPRPRGGIDRRRRHQRRRAVPVQ